MIYLLAIKMWECAISPWKAVICNFNKCDCACLLMLHLFWLFKVCLVWPISCSDSVCVCLCMYYVFMVTWLFSVQSAKWPTWILKIRAITNNSRQKVTHNADGIREYFRFRYSYVKLEAVLCKFSLSQDATSHVSMTSCYQHLRRATAFGT